MNQHACRVDVSVDDPPTVEFRQDHCKVRSNYEELRLAKRAEGKKTPDRLSAWILQHQTTSVVASKQVIGASYTGDRETAQQRVLPFEQFPIEGAWRLLPWEFENNGAMIGDPPGAIELVRLAVREFM